MEAKKIKVVPPPEHDHDEHGDDFDPFHGQHKKGEEGEGPWLMSYSDLMTLLMGFFALIASFSKVDAQEFDKVKKEAVKYFGGEYERPYGGLTERLQREIQGKKLQDQIDVQEMVNGVQVTIKGTLLFDSGSFSVRNDSQSVMQQLAQTVAKEAKGFSILVEGHTDNVPISDSVIASNWELSGIRAARVAHFFEEQGFTKNQLMIVGWGESKPLVSNEDANGQPNTGNRSQNRRVVVKIYKDSI